MPPGREATRGARPASTIPLAPPRTGRKIIEASWAGTIILAVTSVLAVIDPDSLGAPALVVGLAMFFVGTGIFAWSYVVAIGRSRESDIGLAGVYGLSGAAARTVRLSLFGSLAAEVVVAVGGIAARPRSSLAFGFLSIMWGLGLVGLWGAYHGAFPARGAVGGRPRQGGR